MRHVRADGYHADVVLREYAVAVLHHLLGLARIDERVVTLLGTEGVARQLVVAHMAAQYDEALTAARQLLKAVVTLQVEVELLACVGGKAVEDNLPEAVVVPVDVEERPAHAAATTPTEVSVHGDVALMREHHVEGYGKYGHAQIHEAQVQVLERVLQHAVHPRHSVGVAVPLSVFQLFHDATLPLLQYNPRID